MSGAGDDHHRDGLVQLYCGSGVLGREAKSLRDSWISTGIGGGVGR